MATEHETGEVEWTPESINEHFVRSPGSSVRSAMILDYARVVAQHWLAYGLGGEIAGLLENTKQAIENAINEME